MLQSSASSWYTNIRLGCEGLPRINAVTFNLKKARMPHDMQKIVIRKFDLSKLLLRQMSCHFLPPGDSIGIVQQLLKQAKNKHFWNYCNFRNILI
jgi:hypothetical protein